MPRFLAARPLATSTVDNKDKDDRRPTLLSRVWDNLSEEGNAARECWTKETWDEMELMNWPDESKIDNNAVSKSVEDSSFFSSLLLLLLLREGESRRVDSTGAARESGLQTLRSVSLDLGKKDRHIAMFKSQTAHTKRMLERQRPLLCCWRSNFARLRHGVRPIPLDIMSIL